jgi:NAD(P)-dependent dehydrogenase (short-subunit alcohol dehydrogenase family)
MRSLVERAMARFGRLDAAFNNATDGPLPAPLADIDASEFDRGIATNVRGTFLGMKFPDTGDAPRRRRPGRSAPGEGRDGVGPQSPIEPWPSSLKDRMPNR